MGYFIARVDDNQAEIVETFRKAGFSVFDTSGIGRGFPDLILGRNSYTWLVEIKMPEGKLNKKQIKFHQEWKGCAIAIIRSVEEAVEFSRNVP